MYSHSKYLIVIVGPTAVGKTNLSIQLAQKLATEILSADARQFYYDMAIGTAQPSQEEMQNIPHHFLSFLPIQTCYTAGTFAEEALERLDKLFLKKEVVLLTGGSGLYIQALCEGLAPFPSIDTSFRILLNRLLQEKGLPYLTQILAEKDPSYHRIVDLHNPKRVIRALEVCLGTGLPYSTLRTPPQQERPFKMIKIGLTQEKNLLHQRIDSRVDAMMKQGLLQEVEKLYPYKEINALQTIGYKELFNYMDQVYTLPEAIQHIKINTKRYAKKQMTWFKKDKDIIWFTPNDLDSIMHYINQRIQL
ncbi:MAG: tRNA (adenosine(37)-N6)-dimethylallyltransferase MiaA [Amoebophilaceae bacterium]|nr:tRNA (adenosine(37)-N6)-dimethylallyltransferase MiaA [Amoebophilaceae bacterium]